MTEIPTYAKPETKKVDPVQRSIAKPDAFAKPGTLASAKSVRVRLTSGDKQVKGRKKRKRDRRDVIWY